MRILSLLLIAYPLAEIIAFGLVVQWLGFWTALLLVLATSVLGVLIIRHFGFGMAAKMARMARTGIAPDAGMGKDVATIAAGFLLMIPGFITDVLGLLLLIPFVRKAVAGSQAVKTRVYSASTSTYRETYRYGPRGGNGSVVDLDEGEFSRNASNRDDGRQIGPH